LAGISSLTQEASLRGLHSFGMLHSVEW